MISIKTHTPRRWIGCCWMLEMIIRPWIEWATYSVWASSEIFEDVCISELSSRLAVPTIARVNLSRHNSSIHQAVCKNPRYLQFTQLTLISLEKRRVPLWIPLLRGRLAGEFYLFINNSMQEIDWTVPMHRDTMTIISNLLRWLNLPKTCSNTPDPPLFYISSLAFKFQFSAGTWATCGNQWKPKNPGSLATHVHFLGNSQNLNDELQMFKSGWVSESKSDMRNPPHTFLLFILRIPRPLHIWYIMPLANTFLPL